MNETGPRSGRLQVAVVGLSIAALTVFVVWPAVYNGFVHWDDTLYLENVARLKRLSVPSLRWIATALLPLYYHPLTWLSHLMDFQIWGWNLAGHHASSILLHGANAGLVCLFVWMLTGTVRESLPTDAARNGRRGRGHLWDSPVAGRASGVAGGAQDSVVRNIFTAVPLCVFEGGRAIVAVGGAQRRAG